jgi:hypothetical protein
LSDDFEYAVGFEEQIHVPDSKGNTLRRAWIPSGWLIITSSKGINSLQSIYDPKHEWVLDKLPIGASARIYGGKTTYKEELEAYANKPSG